MKLNKPYTLDKLSQYVGGDEGEIQEMISLFLETIPIEINQLPILAEKHDWQSIYKIAHKIKPSFDVFAMDDILIDIKNIELLARENNKDGKLVSFIPKLMKKFGAVVVLLQAELDE
jgi:hypothetical protein